MQKQSNKGTIQRVIVGLLSGTVMGLILFLFWGDLVTIMYQYGIEKKLIEEPVAAFSVKEGYVEYIAHAETLKAYPDLSSVHARLFIERVAIDGKIVEGSDEQVMNYGFWHFPSASPYAQKGNVVIIGHRYLNVPPRKDTFYHLDKVRTGDTVVIQTDTDRFMYKVRYVAIIQATETSVLQQTENAQLTLITCHPLWTSRERLVIIADKI